LALENGVKTSFDATLERYAAEIAASPFDVVLRTDRCRFLQRAAVEYEYSSWAAEVFELAEDCVAELEAEFPEHPEARLLSTERLYGDERLARLSELVEAAKPPEWTPAQRARLFALYAQTLSGSDGSRAAIFARDALALDPTSDVRLILARDLVAKGEGAEAARVLES